MAWLAVNKDETEGIYDTYPFRDGFSTDTFWRPYDGVYIHLPKGTIKKLINRQLTWENEPVEIE